MLQRTVNILMAADSQSSMRANTRIGNCLFRAIADQLWADDRRHPEVRKAVVAQMYREKQFFVEFFSVVEPRRGAKRKAAGPNPVAIDHGSYSRETRDLALRDRLVLSSQLGDWGDSTEALAAAQFYEVDVLIHQAGQPVTILPGGKGEKQQRPQIALAYHGWRHYTSVRRVDSLHIGVYNNHHVDGAASQSTTPLAAPAAPAAAPFHLQSTIPVPASPVRSRGSTPGSVSIGRDDDDASDSDYACDKSVAKRSRRSSTALLSDRAIKRVVSIKNRGKGKGKAVARPTLKPARTRAEEQAFALVSTVNADDGTVAPHQCVIGAAANALARSDLFTPATQQPKDLLSKEAGAPVGNELLRSGIDSSDDDIPLSALVAAR